MNREPYQQKSRMVEISKSGSGEGRGWATGPGYSTNLDLLNCKHSLAAASLCIFSCDW